MVNFEKIKRAAYYLMAIFSMGAVLFMFAIIADSVSKMPTGYSVAGYEVQDIGSCRNSCGIKPSAVRSSCYCDNLCLKYRDCCGDYKKYCEN